MVLRPKPKPALPWFAAAFLAGAVGLSGVTASAASAAATKATSTEGTITGTVAGSLPSANGDASVRVADASTGGIVAVKRPGKHGAFKLTLDPGAYVVTATVVSSGGALSRTTVAVSLKKKQKRTVRLVPKKVTTAAAGTKPVSTAGAAQPTPIPFAIEPFVGGTGSWQSLGAGLSSVLMGRINGQPVCDTTVVENSTVLPFLKKVGKASKYFTKTKVKRKLLTPAYVVSGTVKPTNGGSTAQVTIVITDTSTGKVLDTITANFSKARWANAAAQVEKVVAERICRTPSTYAVALHINGVFDFPGYQATGTIDSTVPAKTTGQGVAWAGSGAYKWANVAYKSKAGCTFTNIQPASGTWAASVSTKDGSTIALHWGLDLISQTHITIGVARCPKVIPIPNVPGPSQINLSPTDFTFPAEGGSAAIAGGVTPQTLGFQDNAGLGFTNTGTITVAPVWKYKAP